MDAISRRAFAERLALAIAAPYLVDESPLSGTERGTGGEAGTERERQVERLYQMTLTNADEPDFVYSVYRGDD